MFKRLVFSVILCAGLLACNQMDITGSDGDANAHRGFAVTNAVSVEQGVTLDVILGSTTLVSYLQFGDSRHITISDSLHNVSLTFVAKAYSSSGNFLGCAARRVYLSSSTTNIDEGAWGVSTVAYSQCGTN